MIRKQIQSAQIVVPCVKFGESLEFFTERLGFRLDVIFPADAPSTAVLSGYGLTLRLEESNEIQSLTLRLTGDFELDSEIYSPDGVRVCLIDEKSAFGMPEIKQEFVVSTLEGEGAWNMGRAGMLYRDLIPSRLGGGLVASHISIPSGGEVPDYVHFHKVRFQMIYCLAGWAKLVYEDQGEPFVMHAGDCVLQPPEIRHRVLETSDNFEVLELGCPAIHETHADHALDLPNRNVAPERVFNRQIFVHHQNQNAVWQRSEFANIESRDTGIAEATRNFADVRALRTTDDAKFSIRHTDDLLFFFVVSGHLKLINENGETHLLTKGASVALPNDTEYFAEIGKNTEMVRVSFPAR